jgi:hypothetical protein
MTSQRWVPELSLTVERIVLHFLLTVLRTDKPWFSTCRCTGQVAADASSKKSASPNIITPYYSIVKVCAVMLLPIVDTIMAFSNAMSSLLAMALVPSDFDSMCDLLCLRMLELQVKRGLLLSSADLVGGGDFRLVSSLVNETR